MSTPNASRLLAIVLVILLSVTADAAWADARQGQQYAERWCSQCHGVQPRQVSSDEKAPSFSELAANPSTTRHSLTVSLQTTPHWTMPKIKPKPADINDVVSYILSLRSPH